MYHLRRAPLASWPPKVPGAPGSPPIDGTKQDLLNMGMLVLGADATYVYFDVGLLAAHSMGTRDQERIDALPGERISEATYLAGRFGSLPAEAKPLCLRAHVYRSLDGSHLRNACLAAAGAHHTDAPAKQLPQSDKGRAVLEHARSRATGPRPTAQRLQVRHNEILDGDVVENDSVIPHSWLGEPES